MAAKSSRKKPACPWATHTKGGKKKCHKTFQAARAAAKTQAARGKKKVYVSGQKEGAPAWSVVCLPLSKKKAGVKARCETGPRRKTAKKAARKVTHRAPRKNKDGAVIGRWKADPRGGRSRVIVSKSGERINQWEPMAPPKGRRTILYIYDSGKDSMSVRASSYVEARQKVEATCKKIGISCDLRRVRYAKKNEIRAEATAWTD